MFEFLPLTLPLHSALQHRARIFSCKIKGWVGFATAFLVTLILFTGNALRAVFCTDFLACPVEAARSTFLVAGEPEAVSVQLAHAQAVVIITRIFVSDELENVSFKVIEIEFNHGALSPLPRILPVRNTAVSMLSVPGIRRISPTTAP